MLSILRQRTVKHTLIQAVKLARRLRQFEKRSEYYFGYGANLSIDRFHKRKMNVEEVGNARLTDHEIRFELSNEYRGKGYAGVRESKGSEVWGVLYKMDSLSLALLDTLEWCGFGAYERVKTNVTINVNDGNDQTVTCWCYKVKYPKQDLIPSKLYLSNMIKASQQRGFPKHHIELLEKHKYAETFEIDYGFSLLFYGRRRFLEKELRPFYKVHDKIREKLCEMI